MTTVNKAVPAKAPFLRRSHFSGHEDPGHLHGPAVLQPDGGVLGIEAIVNSVVRGEEIAGNIDLG